MRTTDMARLSGHVYDQTGEENNSVSSYSMNIICKQLGQASGCRHISIQCSLVFTLKNTHSAFEQTQRSTKSRSDCRRESSKASAQLSEPDWLCLGSMAEARFITLLATGHAQHVHIYIFNHPNNKADSSPLQIANGLSAVQIISFSHLQWKKRRQDNKHQNGTHTRISSIAG